MYRTLVRTGRCPKGPPNASLRVLEDLLVSRRRLSTIIAGDAKTLALGGTENDTKEKFMDLVGATNLMIKNHLEATSTSDHNRIVDSDDDEDKGVQRIDREKKLVVSQADRNMFGEVAAAGRNEIHNEETVEGATSTLRTLAMRTCKTSMPWRAGRDKIWWNADLKRLRRATRKARATFQRERDQERRVKLHEKFKRKRGIYKDAIKRAKMSSLEHEAGIGSLHSVSNGGQERKGAA
jgi:hypothetical protein